MQRSKWLLSALLVFALKNAHVAEVHAADNESEARQHYERAVQLYTQGDYEAALAEMIRTRELNHSYKILSNIAQVRVAMNNFAGALQAYRQYLDEGGSNLSRARREAVQKEMNDLELRVATVTVEADVHGAEVLIDKVNVGVTPLAQPLWVNAGTHEILVRHRDHPAQDKPVSLAGGARDRLFFALMSPVGGTPQAPFGPTGTTVDGSHHSFGPNGRAPAQINGTAAVPSDEAAPANLNAPKWIAWSIFGVFVTGATVTGILALSANSSLENMRKEHPTDLAKMTSEATRVATLATVTDGLWIAAAAACGVSLWLTLDPSAMGGHSTGSHGQPSLSLGAGPSAIQLRARF